MADQPPPTKRAKPLDMESTFDVLVGAVGKEQKRFTLHTSFFIPRSEFFRAARSAAWNKDNESQKPTALTDDDPPDFSNYLRCVYSGTVDFLPFGEIKKAENFSSLTRLYVLADKLCDLRTANMVIDRMVGYSDEMKRMPGPGSVALAYSSTASGSPLRALLCDYFIHQKSARCLGIDKATDYPRDFPPDFFQDIAFKYLQIKHTNLSNAATVEDAFRVKASSRGRCHYHQHDSNWTEMECTSKCPQSQSTPTPVKVVHVD